MAAQPSVDPAVIAAVANRLARARDEAFDVSNELLEHYVETGDAASQHAVDQLVEQAADTLRALTDALTDTTRRIRLAAQRYAEADRAALRGLDPCGDDG
jgi:uncharacterized protein YukE